MKHQIYFISHFYCYGRINVNTTKLQNLTYTMRKGHRSIIFLSQTSNLKTYGPYLENEVN